MPDPVQAIASPKTSRLFRRHLWAISFVAVLMAGCSEHPNEAAQETDITVPVAAQTQLPIEVSVTHASIVDIAEPMVATGTIAAKQTSNIGALTPGVIDKIYVGVGDRVTKGQPLFRTRTIEYERRLAEAEAALAIAKASAANTRAQFVRFSDLVTDGAVSQAGFDNVKTKMEIAEAEVQLREAQLATAQQALSDATVRAPFNGAITARFVDEGVFMANSFSGMGNSAVVQVQECEIAAGILFTPEQDIGHLRLGLTGRLFVDGQAEPIPSKILLINDQVDATTRMVEFRMAFRNPNCRVKAGQYVRAEIDLDERPALVLPRTVLQGSGDERYVYLAIDGAAVRRSVDVRDIDALQIEVLKGLTDADLVITGPSDALHDNALVRVAGQ